MRIVWTVAAQSCVDVHEIVVLFLRLRSPSTVDTETKRVFGRYINIMNEHNFPPSIILFSFTVIPKAEKTISKLTLIQNHDIEYL